MFVCTTSVYAFEIKPICPILGAYCKSANIDDLAIQNPASKKCLNETRHTILGNNQPVHEAITRTAYKQAFGKELTGFNHEKYLIGGVEWNDDPEILLRTMWRNFGFIKAVWLFPQRFKMLFIAKDKNPTTHRSHFGDMQFLHAMKSNKNLSDQDVKQQIYDWIKNAYAIRKGDIKYDQDIQGTYFEKYFTKELGFQKISDIFDPKRAFKDKGILEQRVKFFASGSILHLIQDSYSQSHTKRKDRVGEIESFEIYPQDDHCLSDINSNENKKEIMKAVEMSASYMKKVDSEDNDWCKDMAPFIKGVFNIREINDESCQS